MRRKYLFVINRILVLIIFSIATIMISRFCWLDGYQKGNEDGYQLRFKTDMSRKHPELFNDIWLYNADEVTENKWQEKKNE